MRKLVFSTLPGIPLIEPGDNLVSTIENALSQSGESLQEHDVLVVAQKIVSKAEDRYVFLADIKPSAEAIALAEEVQKDPRHVHVILSESKEVVRKKPGVLIVEHRLGFVHANAGVDRSNIASDPETEPVLLLPYDPDASARRLREGLESCFGVQLGVIISDTSGRAWRNGLQGLAIGVSGFTPLENLIGGRDLFERELQVTEVATADEMAAGASLLMGQKDEKTPIVLVRGYQSSEPEDDRLKGIKPLLRPKDQDLFR